MKDFFLIARVISVHGSRGYIKIQSFSDFPERFSGLKEVYIDFFGDKKKFIVEDSVKKKNDLLLKFSNFSSAEDARILNGKDIFVDEASVIKLPEFTFFVHDLIGSEVLEENKNLGIITDVLTYPANDIYVIESADGRELLIPAVKDIIESFDPEKKILVLKPGSSLYDED